MHWNDDNHWCIKTASILILCEARIHPAATTFIHPPYPVSRAYIGNLMFITKMHSSHHRAKLYYYYLGETDVHTDNQRVVHPSQHPFYIYTCRAINTNLLPTFPFRLAITVYIYEHTTSTQRQSLNHHHRHYNNDAAAFVTTHIDFIFSGSGLVYKYTLTQWHDISLWW